MPSDTLTLSSSDLELQLSPSIGGTISRLAYLGADGATAILRDSHTPLENVLEAASFPLVPYVNRVRDGSFTFRGRTVSMTPNMAGDPSPLHGQGWLNPWSVEEASGNRALLSYRHERGRMALELRGAAGVPGGGGGAADRPDLPQHVGRAYAVRTWPASLFPVQRGAPGSRRASRTPGRSMRRCFRSRRCRRAGRYDLSNRLICGQNLDNGFRRLERPSAHG